MEKDIVIVGGGPAGIVTALTAKSVYPDKSVCVVKAVGDGVLPCAIPYMIHSMEQPEDNRVGNQPLEQAGINIVVDEAVSLDPAQRRLSLGSGTTMGYERLVLATGTTPTLPAIPGIDKKGVFPIEKSMASMAALRAHAKTARHVVILGGGFIGAEFADELIRDSDVDVHIVEILPKLLQAAFDDDFCEKIESQLTAAGVHLHKGIGVASINGNTRVDSVELNDGKRLAADMVIIGIGGKPNISLARQAGLRTTDGGSIWVDAYMRSSDPVIFAVGDCALKRDFFTRREAAIWLASTATAEARIAGTNIYGIRVLRQIQGTIAAFSTKIGDLAFASSGLTCRACEKEGFRIVSATATAPDRHPGTLPGARPMTIKLIFADRSGALLGGQVCGGLSVGELINTIAIGIQMKLNVRDLDMMQIATHPLLTSAPTVHPLINAAHQALATLRQRDRLALDGDQPTAVMKPAD